MLFNSGLYQEISLTQLAGRKPEFASDDSNTYPARSPPIPPLHAEHHKSHASRTAVAVWAICAETDEQAQYLASSSRMSMRMLRQGHLIPVPPPEKAIKYLRSIGQPTDSGFTDGRRGVIGSPDTVRTQLHEVADSYGAEEVIVVTITYDHEARKRSYELIAEAVGLEPRELDDAEPALAAGRASARPSCRSLWAAAGGRRRSGGQAARPPGACACRLRSAYRENSSTTSSRDPLSSWAVR